MLKPTFSSSFISLHSSFVLSSTRLPSYFALPSYSRSHLARVHFPFFSQHPPLPIPFPPLVFKLVPLLYCVHFPFLLSPFLCRLTFFKLDISSTPSFLYISCCRLPFKTHHGFFLNFYPPHFLHNPRPTDISSSFFFLPCSPLSSLFPNSLRLSVAHILSFLV